MISGSALSKKESTGLAQSPQPYNGGRIILKEMAHSILLSSVADEQVIAAREGRRSTLEAGLSISCSHLLTSWVRPDDLRKVLRQAIDGGEILGTNLPHAFRPPLWHPSTSTSEIESKLRKVWNEQQEMAGSVDPSDWYVVEIGKVVKLFGHAANSHNGVVSFVELVAVDEHARRVSIPVVDRPKFDS
jgi:hypothetical protein